MRIFSNPDSDWFCPLQVRTLSGRKYKSLTYLDNHCIAVSPVLYLAKHTCQSSSNKSGYYHVIYVDHIPHNTSIIAYTYIIAIVMVMYLKG